MSGEVFVAGTVTPAAGHNTFPALTDVDLFNGCRVVQNHAARNGINSTLLSAGALVLVVDSDGGGTFAAYRYLGTDPTSDANWAVFAASAGGIKWSPLTRAAREALTIASADVSSLAYQTDEQTLWVAISAGTGASHWAEVNGPSFGNLPGVPTPITTATTTTLATIPVAADTVLMLDIEVEARDTATGRAEWIDYVTFSRVGSGPVQDGGSKGPAPVSSIGSLSGVWVKYVISSNTVLVQIVTGLTTHINVDTQIFIRARPMAAAT